MTQASVSKSRPHPKRDSVRVTVRLFASVRERARASQIAVSLHAGATVADVLVAASKAVPGEWRLPSKLMVAVNGEYAEMTASLRDGDEVALIPPVSGGAEKVARLAGKRRGRAPEFAAIQITDQPLDAALLIDYVRADKDGAVVTFYGVTRDHNDGRRVKYLEYEAYEPMAGSKIVEIIGEMKSRWEIGRVAVAHRTGRVDIGETSMVLAVSAPHRRPAFEAALYFVDRLKEIVPIWKKEYFEGGDVWIGDTPGKVAHSARRRP